MTPSGLALLKQFEGIRLDSYKDSAGIWTVGYGHTGSDVHEGLLITPAKAEELLLDDVSKAEEAVVRAVVVPINDDQRDALTSFVYNIGVGAFSQSTLLTKLNHGDYQGAAEELLRWNQAGGKVLPGLVERRKAERALFLAGSMPVGPAVLFPDPTPADMEVKPMFSILAAALPSLLQAAPDLIRAFGSDGKVTERNAQAAELVANLAKQASGTTSIEDAIGKINSDPAAADAFRTSVRDRWYELSEFGGGVEKAAERALKMQGDKPAWMNPALWMSASILPLVYMVFAAVLYGDGWSDTIRAMVVTAGVTGVLGAITGFWLGSSMSSRGKDELLANQRR